MWKRKFIIPSFLNLIRNIILIIDSIWRWAPDLLIWLRSQLPALLGLLGSLFFWLTFKNFWPDTLYATWYPLIYLCICVGILFFPFDILHRNSRRWFAIANVCTFNVPSNLLVSNPVFRIIPHWISRFLSRRSVQLPYLFLRQYIVILLSVFERLESTGDHTM